MYPNIEVLEGNEGNVSKYIFSKQDAVVEAVLYKYEDYTKRTVICCSVQSGCPVGCTFCGTGAKFIRNLSWEEIAYQIIHILEDKNIDPSECEKIQVMFMSMGEPMLNFYDVSEAIRAINWKYSNIELLLSTIGVDDVITLKGIIELSEKIDKVGLQFSIHKSNDEDRNILIPYKNKMSLEMIRDFGIDWHERTGRHPYLNYCIDGTNNTEEDFKNLTQLFSPFIFNFTFSVVCSKDETMKDASYRNLDEIRKFQDKFLEKGYNVRIFDPAGQDDIGGGCGQLWFVQQWLKEYNNKGDK